MPAEVPTVEEVEVSFQRLDEALDRHMHDTEEELAQTVHEVWTVDELRRAVDIARTDGGGTIHLAREQFVLPDPLTLPRYTRLVGSGTGATSIRAGADMEFLLGFEDYASSVSIEKLRLDCDKKARTGVRIVPAPRDPNNGKDYGLTAPDPRHRMFDVEVYDAAHTGVVLGEHARGSKLIGVVVRRAGTVGFHCGMADSDLIVCEATVVAGAPYSGASAFWVGSVNSRYVSCKGWWGRGSGWRVRGSRNTFTACEAQDNAWHGWYIEYDLNSFIGCFADNSGYHDSGGVGGVDGFYFVGAGSTAVVGCQAYNRSDKAKYQRHGFNIPRAMLDPIDPAIPQLGTRFVASVGKNNAGKLVHVR